MTAWCEKTTRNAYVSPIKPIEMNEDGCFERVLSCDPQDSDWLPMTPATGTLASPERTAATVQVIKSRRSVLGDSHIAFAQLKRPSDFSNKLKLSFNLRGARRRYSTPALFGRQTGIEFSTRRSRALISDAPDR